MNTIDFYSGKNYLISGWINVDDQDIPDLSANNLSMSFQQLHDGVLDPITNFETDGVRIDGWQRFSGEFEVEGHTGGINEFNFVINIGDFNKIYLDDLRVQPIESQMQCNVYDSSNYLLLASLDDNNYYTKYKYDGQGNLISIVKETERGPISLKESRTVLKPTNNFNE